MKTNWKTQKTTYRKNSYIKLVEKIYKAKNKPTRYKKTIETMLLEFFGKTSKTRNIWKREVFKTLLIHAYHQKCYALLRDYKSVEVLHNISAFGNKLVRNIEDWECNNFDKEEQLRALIRHCFANYETPVFLENSFFGCNKRDMLWYIQIGKGKSVKSLTQMPINLTKKMAHGFKNAPAYFDANEALRYTQALGFGASIKTAKVIAFSSLSVINKREEIFWATVVQFFAKETSLKTVDVNEMFDYLGYKYRENKSFSVKGRTQKSLLFQANEWKKRVYRDEIVEVLSWKASGIKPLNLEQTENGKPVVYKTVELLNSIALFDEGNAMHHCVAEYDEDCKYNDIAIFSLQKESIGESITRLATIEVGLKARQIFEAKAKYNEKPNVKSLELIDLWINNAQIKQMEEVEHEVYQPNNNVRVDNNGVYVADESYDTTTVVKVIFWILYLIAKVLLFS
ncbi:PcfJ domain-containing protein [Polaribacter vadi]|uniref:PcfJ domain-containing protein n=1 Tax=Polaribacter TaxID=52959 RepID=UPI001C07F411|nr:MULTISPECIES: PcfJ domain-containing protein [Polaribacter]MBU3011494.1 PcfJ domain-containing protein [Polaribacter vadi]MDO6741306.1 PcfJ domain-containing protein [Polaribacter sp. 1_MG-2023]